MISSETIPTIHSAHCMERYTWTAHATKLLQKRGGPLRSNSHVNVHFWVGFLQTFLGSNKTSTSNSSENRMGK